MEHYSLQISLLSHITDNEYNIKYKAYSLFDTKPTYNDLVSRLGCLLYESDATNIEYTHILFDLYNGDKSTRSHTLDVNSINLILEVSEKNHLSNVFDTFYNRDLIKVWLS